MSEWPFKDLKVAEHLAEDLIKAGWSCEIPAYYKISEENRLAGGQIKDLVFGRKMAGSEGLIERTKDGTAYCRKCFSSVLTTFTAPTFSDTGKNWIENNLLCDQWQMRFQGHKIYYPVYRNPEGKREKLEEYLSIPGLGLFFMIIPWSLVN
jgi:hypothetical protein